MTDLARFLLARIGEDEAMATAAAEFWAGVRVDSESIFEERHIARHDPARVLAECDAKRRIVTDYVETAEALECLPTELAFSSTLRYLALPYADHEDFREEWKP